MNITQLWHQRFGPAISQLRSFSDAELDELLSMIRPARDPQFGDYQANVAMPLGKQLGKSPRDIAAAIVATLDVTDICHAPEIAGPGFINLRLRDKWLVSQLETVRRDPRLGCSSIDTPMTFIVDFSSPNVAKPLHVGHIRSTCIGDALCRILRFRGHHVISDNHLGDWGTQFGMIIYGYKHFVDPVAYKNNPLEELGRLYRLVRRLTDYHDGVAAQPLRLVALEQMKKNLQTDQVASAAADPAEEKKRQRAFRKSQQAIADAEKEIHQLRESLAAATSDPTFGPMIDVHAAVSREVLEETAKLHAGDPYNRSLWEEFLPKCREAIQGIYERLNISFDVELGESFYHDRLPGIVDALRESGLARESEGAVGVFLDGFAAPFLIQKKDGAYLYATSDLATIAYRQERWSPDVVLYVVDFRQSEHFEKLFATARQWGFDKMDLRHIKFGTVLGEDGKPYKTRSGDTVGLIGLLDEAEARAYEVVAANDESKPDGWELDEPTRRHIAKVVGLAALKYADLSQNRESDYVFSYDKMLLLTGNTATYMQYSYARVFGIFAKGGVNPVTLRESDTAIHIQHPAERALALRLLQFEEAIDEVLVDYRPNLLTSYLFDLAKTFSAFFEQCPVLKADSEPSRNSRLLLCDLTARTLQQGLQLLGIDVVPKM